MYIRYFGIIEGPLEGFPLNPKFPFLSILICDPSYFYDFPRETYITLCYFVKICPFGIIFNKWELIRYWARIAKGNNKTKYNVIFRWLRLFGNFKVLHDNLRPKGNNKNGIRE